MTDSKHGVLHKSYIFVREYLVRKAANPTDKHEQPELPRFESFEEQPKRSSWSRTLLLGFSSLGSIYGDIGTSPIYTLQTVYVQYPNPTQEEVYGIMSLIFYLFTMIVVVKYALIVIKFGAHNEEGGQIALYSKIKKCAMQSNLVNTRTFSLFTLLLCFVGCSLAISDGLLTPCTSVMNAVSGLKVMDPSFSNEVPVTLFIFGLLFSIQRFGAHRISFCFAPIIMVWLVCLVSIGFYNIITYHPQIFRALSPTYAYSILKGGNFHILSSCVISITGAEAMFLDLGYIGQFPIQLTTIFFVYPCLMACYLGQSAYIIANPEKINNIFYNSIPGQTGGTFYWSMLYLATLSTIIASQSLILGVYSIIHQLIDLGFFPKLKIIHLDRNHKNSIYIPVVNRWLLFGLVVTTLLFTNSEKLASAYGLGVSFDFLVTSLMMLIVLSVVYQFNPLITIAFAVLFVPLEILIVNASLSKFYHGGWFTVAVNCIFFSFLATWTYCQNKRLEFESKNAIDMRHLLDESSSRQNRFQEVTPLKKDMHPKDYGAIRSYYNGILFFHESNEREFSQTLIPGAYSQFLQNYPSVPAAVIFASVNITSEPEAHTRIDIYSMESSNIYKVKINFGFMEEVVIDKDLIDDLKYSILDLCESLPVLHVQESCVVKSDSSNVFKKLLIEGIYGPLHRRFQMDQVDQLRLHENFDRISILSQVIRI